MPTALTAIKYSTSALGLVLANLHYILHLPSHSHQQCIALPQVLVSLLYHSTNSFIALFVAVQLMSLANNCMFPSPQLWIQLFHSTVGLIAQAYFVLVFTYSAFVGKI